MNTGTVDHGAGLRSLIAISGALLWFAFVGPAAAQIALPGETQGTGTDFAVLDSSYLPVTLQSSVSVSVTLSSVPEIVSLLIDADPAAGSAEFTLGGFAPDTTYYRYTDNGLNPVTFTTDASGSFTFTQDLNEPHHVWFRDKPSTHYLYDNATGGDCTAALGTWSATTKTCTLTHNVFEPIFIQSHGITLDGAGYQVSTPGNYAVYSFGFNSVTVKNVRVVSSTIGFRILGGSGFTVQDSTVSGHFNYGIELRTSPACTISGNTVASPAGPNPWGIFIQQSPGCTVANNLVTGQAYALFAYTNSHNAIIRGNTLSNSGYGLVFGNFSDNGQVYNNNFVNNSFDFLSAGSSFGGTGNVFNLAAPVGGNYYSAFHTSPQGCNDANSDGFCDAARPVHYFGGMGQDNLPWTTQDGWLTPADTVAPTASPTQAPAANAAGWNNTDVVVSWNWTDNTGGSGLDPNNCTTSSPSIGEGSALALSANCRDPAGNSSDASWAVKVDKTPPTVSLVDGPADGGSHYFGSVPAAPTCAASDALSQVAGSCAVSGYSSAVGAHTVTATAQDIAGNSASTSADYTVLPLTLSGFYQPVDMGGVWNTVKGGSTVPLKFEAFAGPTELTSTATVNQPLKATQTLCSGGSTDDIELLASGSTSLRYDDMGGQFVYNWQTPKKPGYCYVVTVTLIDGTSISANFRLK